MQKNKSNNIDEYINSISDEEFLELMKESEKVLWNIDIPNIEEMQMLNNSLYADDDKVIYKNIKIHHTNKTISVDNSNFNYGLDIDEMYCFYTLDCKDGVA